MGTLANIEYPDEMQHGVFHQGMHCLVRLIQPSGTEAHHNLEKSTCIPLKVHNGQSHTYCINMSGKIHQNTKGLFYKTTSKLYFNILTIFILDILDIGKQLL